MTHDLQAPPPSHRSLENVFISSSLPRCRSSICTLLLYFLTLVFLLLLPTFAHKNLPKVDSDLANTEVALQRAGHSKQPPRTPAETIRTRPPRVESSTPVQPHLLVPGERSPLPSQGSQKGKRNEGLGKMLLCWQPVKDWKRGGRGAGGSHAVAKKPHFFF